MTGGMPEMVFEYILKENGIDPEKDLTIIQNIDFGSTAPAFADGRAMAVAETGGKFRRQRIILQSRKAQRRK